MYGITRGLATLIGAAVAGFLIWLATQIGTATTGDYWLTYGLVAAAGLTFALSQLLGGWTKYGWPRLSAGVFLLGFLPVLLVGGFVLLAQQPGEFLNTSNLAQDLGVAWLVDDLGELLAPIALAIGLVLGFTFDTAGARHEVHVDDRETVVAHDDRDETVEERPRTAAVGRVGHDDDGVHRTAADEPLTAERDEVRREDDFREPDPAFRETVVGDRRDDRRA